MLCLHHAIESALVQVTRNSTVLNPKDFLSSHLLGPLNSNGPILARIPLFTLYSLLTIHFFLLSGSALVASIHFCSYFSNLYILKYSRV